MYICRSDFCYLHNSKKASVPLQELGPYMAEMLLTGMLYNNTNETKLDSS